MMFKDLRLKLQALGLRSWLKGNDDGVNRKGSRIVNKLSWMTPISHGYHVVEGRTWGRELNGLEQPDDVIVQREEMDSLELWLYGVYDSSIGDGIAKYMQAHLFSKKLKESQIRRQGKETMRKAYHNARAKLKENSKSDVLPNVGAVSAMVINGEKLVMAQMGEHRVIVCRDGIAHQLRSRHQRAGRRTWPRRLISGAMRIPRVRLPKCHTGSQLSRKQKKCSEVVAATEKIDSDTEFVILASTGVWEVMRNQEAVDLIRHIDNPQEAAECLAREALTRMSRSNISCLVIRLD